MPTKGMTVKQLQTIINDCLEKGFTLAFFLPDVDIRPPTWQEVRQAAMDGYALALGDILDALDGDTEALDLARSPDGRIAIRDEDWARYEELLKKEQTGGE